MKVKGNANTEGKTMYGYGYEDKKVERLAIQSKTLASMLAQEDLRVVFSAKAQTAHFQPSTRELVLPHWDLNNRSLVDMLVEHEVGHAIHSGGIDLASIPAELRGYVNILEDVRVDRLQRENYPGTKKDYFEAGKAMIEMDVFKLGEIDLNTALLIDRINLKSKIGLHIGVPFFSQEEKDFVVRAFATESIEDVLALANEIFEYDRDRREEETEQESMMNDEGEGDAGEPEYVESDSSPEKDESRSEKSEDQSEKTEGENKEDGKDSKDSEDSKEDSKEDGEEEPKDGEKEAGADSEKNASGNKESGTDTVERENKDIGKQDTEEEPKKEAPKPQTADALDNFEKSTKKVDVYSDNVYYDIGHIPLEYAFLRSDLFRKEVAEFTSTLDTIPDYVAEHEKLYRDAIALLRKEFAVHRYARSTSSLKTMRGSIDTNALCLYRINENIFRKTVSVEKNDNNHRIVFLVDNSGSMYSNDGMLTVLKQIVIFRRFCLEEKIPFHVITFTSPTSSYGASEAVTEWYSRQQKIYEHIADNEYLADHKAMVIEILNETDSNEYFNRLVAYIGMELSGHEKMYKSSFRSGMTPTNDALNRLYPWLVGMKKTMKEDKLDLVILTDGEATDSLKSMNDAIIIRDALTRREYKPQDVYGKVRNRYTQYIMPAFFVLKTLKEEKIVNCVVWYNYVNMRFFQGSDFGVDAMRRIAKQVINKYEEGMFFNKIIAGIKRAIRSNGVLCAKSPFDFIDMVYFFISPRIFQYYIENEISKNPDADKNVFRAERKASGIFKSLAGNCAKFLG